MDKIKKFLAEHSITAHSIAVLGSILVAMFYEVPQLHDTVMGLYGHFPQWAKTLVTVGFLCYLWYKNNKTRWTPEMGERRTIPSATSGQVNNLGQGASNNG